MQTPSSLTIFGGVGTPTPEAERRFFTKVRLSNGTYKTTYRHRLDDLNEKLIEFVPRDRCLTIMDVAVSSGISTIEWSDHLQAHGIQHRMVAGDLVTDAWLTSWGTWLAVLFDSNQRDPLLLEIGPLMVPVRSDRWLARMVRPLLFPLLRAIAAVGRRSGLASPMAPAVPGRWVHRSIPFVSPDLHHRAEIVVVQDDITVSGRFAEAFDAIRVANLIHRVYFDDAATTRIVHNLWNRLRDGGILAICRTMEDGTNHATIFRRRGNCFVSEASINNGAEVCALVLALRFGGNKKTLSVSCSGPDRVNAPDT
jgi:hypothetical protein